MDVESLVRDALREGDLVDEASDIESRHANMCVTVREEPSPECSHGRGNELERR